MLDLTYRCNNHCLHCWLWEPSTAEIVKQELTFDEICQVVDEARQMGCQAWKISGGEPMLRPDFPEIFGYITHKAIHYSLNTNGTLITPEIARLMTRKGRKMVVLYGATAQVHDQVTRNPGSFEAMLRGLAYLREAGAHFEIQIIPMRANIHQYEKMLALAQELSPHMRIGSSWLFLSASGAKACNAAIQNQRLAPIDVINIDPPYPFEDFPAQKSADEQDSIHTCLNGNTADDRLFAGCIEKRRNFHIDPFGQMSFCYYVKDRSLRYDLMQGSFQEAWDEFIPSLAEIVHGGPEYQENCGSCNQRSDCHWCPVYAYLEHGRYSAKIAYLCDIAAETRRYKEEWRSSHIRYFQIAGMTIQVSADSPFSDATFHKKLSKFQISEPGEDIIGLHHVSHIPDRSEVRIGKEIYHKRPWAIFQHKDSFTYMGIPPEVVNESMFIRAIFNHGHTQGTIYHPTPFKDRHGLESLTSFTTDQILLAPVLADRQAFLIHAAGLIIDGQGILFVGHSEAGKSTMLKMLRDKGEILCDDRIILRRWPEGFRIHGTWSHGELPDISPSSAPLRAIFYLEQADKNTLIPIENSKERFSLIVTYVIKSLQTADWWEKILDVTGKVASEVPAYKLQFDLSGDIIGLLEQLLQQ
ncbi:MAG: radical SAM protein [Brevefilum sp.]|nr:radical SAM protein [Brevefilum sp.]